MCNKQKKIYTNHIKDEAKQIVKNKISNKI